MRCPGHSAIVDTRMATAKSDLVVQGATFGSWVIACPGWHGSGTRLNGKGRRGPRAFFGRNLGAGADPWPEKK